jgi:hypothetical protein
MSNLSITHPYLVLEWHPEKNFELTPDKVSHGSVKKVWWLGSECGHEWESIIQTRTGQKSGCPFCKGSRVLAGFNDIATSHPEVVNTWHPSLNEALLPTQFSAGSHKKVWWQCEVGHEWKAEIVNRTSAKSNCPYCVSKKVIPGVNDFATLHSELLSEWSFEKNSNLDPSMFFSASSQKAWWKCSKSHFWETSIKTRTRGSGCPICSGNKVIAGINDLATLAPETANQWNFVRNAPLLPSEVTLSSAKKVWWICHNNHEWETTPASRKRGRGCPYCGNKKVLDEYNDLITTHPLLIKQWHPTKNIPMNPQDLTYGSAKSVWWVCDYGHEWKVSPNQRTSYKTDCPECCLPSVSKAEQELADYFRSLGFRIRQSTRTVLPKMELDIYFPDLNFAIEYNGIYWHSERAGKDRTYHYNKWKLTKEKGIQLIQIWEDEYEKSPELVKKMLLHKLGVNNIDLKIFARKTFVSEVEKKDAEIFLNQNHIQGFASGSYYYGLLGKESKELHAVLVLKKIKDGEFNIIRYATNANVIGGFTRLLTYAEKTLEPTKFVTFSDHCVSDGGLYRNNGFIADKILNPDYRYVVGMERKHKFGYRLKRFREDPKLQYVEGLTERELADLNDLARIWDAGKTRWVKNVDPNN